MKETAAERVEEKIEEKAVEKAEEKAAENTDAAAREAAEERVEAASGEKTAEIEKGAEAAKETPQIAESLEEEQAEKPESKEIRGKKAGRIVAGVMELATALALAALAVWLFRNTTGTRLLHVSVALGRVSRYYWIVMIAAVIFLVAGIVTVKKIRQKKGASVGKCELLEKTK